MTVPMGQLNDEQRKKAFYKGDVDVYMADVILKEFVAKGQKALVYSGGHHAVTRYRQPSYDFEKKKVNGLRNNRMGNLVYAKIGARSFNIFLHAPWITKESPEAMACPAGGVILFCGHAAPRISRELSVGS